MAQDKRKILEIQHYNDPPTYWSVPQKSGYKKTRRTRSTQLDKTIGLTPHCNNIGTIHIRATYLTVIGSVLRELIIRVISFSYTIIHAAIFVIAALTLSLVGFSVLVVLTRIVLIAASVIFGTVSWLTSTQAVLE